jgi:hypothetical protein
MPGPMPGKTERYVMRRKPWAMYLWPGLAQLWMRGSWSGLAVAVSAAALLNVALLGTFVWSELITQGLRSALWLLLAGAWMTSALLTARWSRRQRETGQTDATNDAFSEALDHYLKGNWFETERVLNNLLRQDSRDVDARLMLATLLRHRGRLDEAAEQLELLTKLEGGEKWEWEIRRERELLAQARTDNRQQAEQQPGGTSADPPSEIVHVA